MKHRRLGSIWLPLSVLAVTALMGCGVDESLTCGAACDPARRLGTGGPGGSIEAGGGADDSAPSNLSDDAQPGGDSATVGDSAAVDESTGDSGDGAMANDSAFEGGDGSCRGPGGGCGDNGSCCAPFVCTAAQQCAVSCKMSGSCASHVDCCRKTYCDSTSTMCVACRGLGTPCASDTECCSDSCITRDGARTCGGG
jgi:hypothetical protein